MKILGVGLSRTGTLSLTKALSLIGFNAVHWEPQRLRDVVLGQNVNPNFRRYDDVEVVTDLPAAAFYKELKLAYPDCVFILTIRNVDDWYKSIKRHWQGVCQRLSGVQLQEAIAIHRFVYGSEEPSEFLYKKKFNEHTQNILREFPDTLVLNIPGGSQWVHLCNFLSVDIPNLPFPHENRGI